MDGAICRACACAIGLLACAAWSGVASAQVERTPPRLVDGAAPRSVDDTEPTVLLELVVETDGTVSAATAAPGADAALAERAIATVETWRFEPATRDGTPVRARVRFEVRFVAAEVEVEPEIGVEPEVEVSPEVEVAPEVEVSPDVETEAVYSATGVVDPIAVSMAPRATSEHVLSAEQLRVAPHRDGGDLLASAPGVLVVRGEGDGVAHAIVLRGFDAEHGQDVEMSLGGATLNQPTHLHGQGYTDLGFLIPEVVRSIRVTEGVYDPHQGDFATAGSVRFDLGVERRGVLSRTTLGSFDTIRQLALWAPVGEAEGTFVAASYRRTRGYGVQRGGEGASLVLAAESRPGGRVRGRVTGVLYGARYGQAGVVRQDDVEAGRVDFYGAYRDPGAAAQGSVALRALLSGSVEVLGERGELGELGAWVGLTTFELRTDLSGYQQTRIDDPTSARRGDLWDQRNAASSVGLHGRWRSERWDPLPWAAIFFELGGSGRFDLTTQRQSLIDARTGEAWDRRVDATIRSGDVGVFADLDVHLSDVVRLRGGARADLLLYGVDDHLAGGALPPSAVGLVGGPRVTLEWTPAPGLVLAIAYGEGYRSPQALALGRDGSVPFTKARSGDLGARWTTDALELSLAGFVTTLSDDVVFDPDEATLESIGNTTRLGGSLAVRAHPLRWITTAVSATYVHATVDADGSAIPFVPPLAIRAEASADEQVATVGELPFRLRGGAGFSLFGARPTSADDALPPVALLDVSAGITWGPLDVGVDVFNLLDQRWASVGYWLESSWSASAPISTTPARSIAAGAPLSVMATLGVRIE